MNVLFLSISGLSDALRQGNVTVADLGQALLFSNHLRVQFTQMDADMRVSADLPEVIEFIRQADREHRVSWIRKRKGRLVIRTWTQLNVFLQKHGLRPVQQVDDRYTTPEGRTRVVAVNPNLRVFS